MKINRVMIAAPKSGNGKTTVTCALLLALKNKGQKVASYKCGPDYIDPLFHEQVIGVPAKNLDTFFTDENRTKALFLNSAAEKGFSVLEGVMGLFDGLGGVREEGSSYHLAKVTKTPIVLVVEAKGMGRSVIPLIAGFLAYDKEHLIRGVILNRISEGYYEIVKPVIEKELGILVLGFLPDREELRIGSRHLGLILPDELKNIREKLQLIAEGFSKSVSIKDIMEIAESARELEANAEAECVLAETKAVKDNPVIAVAKDEAFCFYYADNLLMLEQNGASIRFFSPLHDEALPKDCDALLIGGGYPELYARKLSENSRMRTAIRTAVKNGMPIVAECGGFMYLHSMLTDREGVSHNMVGTIPAVCFDTGKLVRFGYIEMREKQRNFLPEGETIKGHEFHYYDSTNNGEDVFAIKPVTEKEYSCIMEGENYWMGFPHLYYPSNPAFAEQFVVKAQKYKEKSQ